MMTSYGFEEKLSNNGANVSTPPTTGGKWRTIIVRKKRETGGVGGGCGGGGGGGGGGGIGGGIGGFDEYIRKSGLEPKTYQREGVEFCLRREGGGGGGGPILGGIIADEMGLGKTIVMMGLILANLAAFRRTLIVVPVALIAQWVAQIKNTIIDTGVKPDLTVVVYHGFAGKRSVVLSEGRNGSVWCHRPPKHGGRGGGGAPIDIIITTYGCVSMEEPGISSSNKKAVAPPKLSLITFRADRVIFDEAHNLRNKSSRIFKGAMRVVGGGGDGGGGGGGGGGVVGGEVNCRRPSVWIVTGTPIQNKISDLKSLCYVLGFKMCHVITEDQRRAIRDEYLLRRTKVSVGMVVMEGDEGSEGVEGSGGVEGTEDNCAPRLQSLKHYKSQVPWTSETELDLSREIHRSAKNTTNRAERLKLYTKMRQMCVWPALLNTKKGVYNKLEEVPEDYQDTHGLSFDDFTVAVSKQSKIDRVVATMMAEAEGASELGLVRKSIVFCHYRREMTQLRDMLLRSGVGGSVGGSGGIAIIDGTVSAKERARIFEDAPSVLILQIRTCSEGLNLQAYSDVYFVSPHWNPCVEDQAIARCYRMGQTNVVRVFRFYMTDFVGEADAVVAGESECISTLDHKCEEIQERKRVLCYEFLCGGV
jgi:SNF2 family DNA or RNA helicase